MKKRSASKKKKKSVVNSSHDNSIDEKDKGSRENVQSSDNVKRKPQPGRPPITAQTSTSSSSLSSAGSSRDLTKIDGENSKSKKSISGRPPMLKRTSATSTKGSASSLRDLTTIFDEKETNTGLPPLLRHSSVSSNTGSNVLPPTSTSINPAGIASSPPRLKKTTSRAVSSNEKDNTKSSDSIYIGTFNNVSSGASTVIESGNSLLAFGSRSSMSSIPSTGNSLEAVGSRNSMSSLTSTDSRDSVTKPGTYIRRGSSFKQLATMIKSERSASNKAANAALAARGQNVDSSSSTSTKPVDFMGVASQVLDQQRAVRGFKHMWEKENVKSSYFDYGIHLEKKKLDLVKVAAEYREVKRSQFYQELLVYIVFLVSFYMLLEWVPIRESFEQSDVVRDLICTDATACEINTVEDIYRFAENARSQICNANDPMKDPWIRVGGVFLRQVNVDPTDCSITDGWEIECHSKFSFENEMKEPIVGNDYRVYTWMEGFAPLYEYLYIHIFDYMLQGPPTDYGMGGYTVDLCKMGGTDLLIQDNFISLATRAVTLEFVIVNPATQIYTVGHHVFVIGESSYIQHNPQGSNVRMAYTKYDPDVPMYIRLFSLLDMKIILWLVSFGFFLTYTRAEFTEMKKMGLNSYVSNGWNLFEIIQLYVVGSVLYYIVVYEIQSTETLGFLSKMIREEGDHINMQPILVTFHGLILYSSIGTAMSFLKVFKYLRLNATLNLLWQVLGMAMKDLAGFFFIFNIIFISYSKMGTMAFGHAIKEYSSLSGAYFACFRMLAGDFDYVAVRQANPRAAPLFFGSFVVLVFQVLVNMFIAILSEHYEEAKSLVLTEDEDYDVIRRMQSYLASCSPSVVLPNENEPLELQKGQIVRLISTNLFNKELTRQRAKKTFRRAVWRILACLRFGIKFDRKVFPHLHERAAKRAAEKPSMLYIPLSGNFITLPKGMTIRLEGDALLGADIFLQVKGHTNGSVECVVKGVTSDASEETNSLDDDVVLELLGGEALRVPRYLFAFHVLGSIFNEVHIGIMRAMKFWDPISNQLVDDYHLGRLLQHALEERQIDGKSDGWSSIRFDELLRVIELYLRKDKTKSDSLTTKAVRQETAAIMYRFRNSLVDMPSREKEGQNYRATPLDTSRIVLGSLDFLSDMLAENCHDIWALDRIKQGWTYGLCRDEDPNVLTHPNLISYHDLSKEEQAYDYRTSMETLKTIMSCNFQIVKNDSCATRGIRSMTESSSLSSNAIDVTSISQVKRLRSGGGSSRSKAAFQEMRGSMNEDTPCYVDLPNGDTYFPRPISTEDVDLPVRLTQLVDILAENAHEVWSKGRMDDGWTYGTAREDKTKKHPCLVPFIFLTEVEKEYDVNTAMGTLKMLLAMGFTVEDKQKA